MVEGWYELQFDEPRMPTIYEVENHASTTSGYILYLYHCAILNRAAINAANYSKDTLDPPNAESSESNISVHLNDFEPQGYIKKSSWTDRYAD